MEYQDPPNKSADTEQSDKHVQNTDLSLANGARLPTIDDFVFIKPISRGAFGKVFLGHKKGNPDRLYAIKAMKKSDMINKNLTSQVQAERDAMAKVLSPFIVQLFYSLQSQQNIFLIMEYLIGGDLKSLLAVAGYFDEPMAVMYVAEVTLALEYLHRKGIIHRDIKPDNMLITNKGHIKLTDFGLSKININKFNNQEVPMTPKNMFYQPNFEYFRTPGQILSLKSSLAFSIEKKPGYKTKDRQLTPQSPLMDTVEPSMSPSSTPKLSQYKLMKQKSMRDMLLSHSLSKNKQVPRPTPDKNMSSPKIAPVSSLVSSLEASLNWTQSSESEKHDQSSVNISDLSSIGLDPRPVGFSVSHLDSLNNGPRRSTIASDMSLDDDMEAMDHRDHTDGSDNVFQHSNHSINDSELHQSVELTDGELEGFTDNNFMNNTGTCIKCTCRRRSTSLLKTECYECESHAKAPSRQEKLTDDTPQMHRTDESVRNSYAAKNLEALRLGSYCSEESDSDLNSKENTNDSSLGKGKEIMPVPLKWKERSDSEPIRRHNPRRLVKTKSFSYPSDEESDGGGRYQGHVKFARKRSFYDVEQSPVRRSHSADTGLTQEFRLLRCNGLEPLTKRSNSLPRTRIRFNSGSETWKNDPVKTKTSTEADKRSELVKQCNTRLLTSSRILSGPDSIAVLSAEENRSREAQSDASGSDNNVSEVSSSVSQSKLSATIAKSSSHPSVSGAEFNALSNANSTNSLTDISNVAVSGIKDMDCVDNIHPGKPGFHGTNGIFPLKTKQLIALKKPMISSLRSEGDVSMESPNLSRIGCGRTEQQHSPSVDTDVSVFSKDGTSLSNIERPRSPSPPFRQRERSASLPSQDTPLLPPPPPRARRPSGKVPREIQFSSVAACIPASVYNESRSGNSSGKLDVPMTPEPSLTAKVKFSSPDVRFGQTPKTPLEKPFIRSQSFVSVLRTPYRTPKSVRRAPPPPEEERILGTPDYLAPEVLQQKSHGPGVDWWSLGICMFEFLTGIPPFNDQTPELVFENILKRDIPWPEGEEELSAESRAAIDGLLTMDPDQRPGAKEMKKMAVFGNIDWDHLLNMEAPWIPQPDDSMDTSYFEARNLMQDLYVSDIDF